MQTLNNKYDLHLRIIYILLICSITEIWHTTNLLFLKMWTLVHRPHFISNVLVHLHNNLKIHCVFVIQNVFFIKLYFGVLILSWLSYKISKSYAEHYIILFQTSSERHRLLYTFICFPRSLIEPLQVSEFTRVKCNIFNKSKKSKQFESIECWFIERRYSQ